MRITWITRSFLDYRIPVFKALDEMCGHSLTVIYYKDVPPERTQKKIRAVLGERAIARDKELRIGNKPKIDNASKSNTSFRIPVSPGLVKQIIDSKPDVLISDGFMQWTYAALIVRALKGIPHVMCYERTKYTERNAGKLRVFYRKFVSNWIDAIDCNGQLTKEYVKELLNWQDNRLTTGHMVADTEGMKTAVEQTMEISCKELRDKLNIKGTMLLFVGQLIERKGVEELLDAWKEFSQEEHEATLVYVGTGDLEGKLQQRIKNENIENIVLTGSIDYDSIAVYYKTADCFIIATKEDNWSLVVPEAMACGLPIASSEYNGCWPELVTPENGWVFDSLNKTDIINTLKKIISSKDKLKKMGEVSKSIVASHTAKEAAKSIMDAIEIAKKHCNKNY